MERKPNSRVYRGGQEPRDFDRVIRVDGDGAINGDGIGEVRYVDSDGDDSDRVYVVWRGKFRNGERMAKARGKTGTRIRARSLVLVQRVDAADHDTGT